MVYQENNLKWKKFQSSKDQHCEAEAWNGKDEMMKACLASGHLKAKTILSKYLIIFVFF